MPHNSAYRNAGRMNPRVEIGTKFWISKQASSGEQPKRTHRLQAYGVQEGGGNMYIAITPQYQPCGHIDQHNKTRGRFAQLAHINLLRNQRFHPQVRRLG